MRVHSGGDWGWDVGEGGCASSWSGRREERRLFAEAGGLRIKSWGRRVERGCRWEAGLMSLEGEFNSIVLHELNHLGRRVQGHEEMFLNL